MLEKSLCIAASGVMALSMTACGSDESKTASSVNASLSTISSASQSQTSASSRSASSPSSTMQPTSTVATPTSASPSAPATTKTTTAANTPAPAVTIPPPTDAEIRAMELDPGLYTDAVAKSCDIDGVKINANQNATCPFARAVMRAWKAHGSSADTVIYVKSPTTGKTYGLVCGSGAHGSDCKTKQKAYIWMGI